MTEGRTSVGDTGAEVEGTPTDGTSSPETTPGAPEGTHDDTAGGGTAVNGAAHDGAAYDSPAHDGPAPAEGGTVPAATLPGQERPAAHAAPEAEDDESWADAEDQAYKRELRKGLFFGLAGGLVLGAIVALLLGAFVYPGYLGGPGSPDDTANEIVSALAAKDAPALDGLSCRGPDGAAVSSLSPQVLQLISAVKPSGPTTAFIDTEARTPVDLTLSFQGQTQTLPSEIVIGQVQGDWCLKGLAQRQ
ncbi:hypothetical protein [Actinomycetospora atypica]|uniref:DUF4878 domain-containing protein n=1 Tax=Actinomycetospora atypica TaxID=1290095 RepID=A0ABV9YHM0_9PSEU